MQLQDSLPMGRCNQACECTKLHGKLDRGTIATKRQGVLPLLQELPPRRTALKGPDYTAHAPPHHGAAK